mgnify:FL=1
METIKNNSFFVLGLVLLIGVGIFWFFMRSAPEDAGTEGIIEQLSQFAAVRAEILGTIATLQEIQLDISVLDEPAFRALAEAPQPPDVPVPIGKRNPFEP